MHAESKSFAASKPVVVVASGGLAAVSLPRRRTHVVLVWNDGRLV